MKCPICNVSLTMSERQGIEIDYCPDCRGVWLDRGELDKIIEKSHNGSSSARDEYRESHQDSQTRRYDENGSHKKKKRESILADLFDFGG